MASDIEDWFGNEQNIEEIKKREILLAEFKRVQDNSSYWWGEFNNQVEGSDEKTFALNMILKKHSRYREVLG